VLKHIKIHCILYHTVFSLAIRVGTVIKIHHCLC